MSTVAGTAADPARARMEHWRAIVGETFVPLEARPHDGAPFNGSVTTQPLGQLTLSEVVASSHEILRTPRLISRSDRECYKVSVQLRGDCALAQDGRAVVLRPGDLTVYDATRPYRMVFERDFAMLVLMFPRELLRIPVDSMAGVTATRVPGSGGMGALVSGFLSGLLREVDGLSPVVSGRLAGNVLDLLTTLFAERSQSSLADCGPRQRALLLQVQAYIDAHLADPWLSPRQVADAHHIAVRTLHKLFSGGPTTVAGYIRERRLENCRRDLGDPSLRHRPVSAIAARWGLVDASQFSKLFRDAYGCSPRDYRDAAAGVRAAP